jgi:hypothetical protein
MVVTSPGPAGRGPCERSPVTLFVWDGRLMTPVATLAGLPLNAHDHLCVGTIGSELMDRLMDRQVHCGHTVMVKYRSAGHA